MKSIIILSIFVFFLGSTLAQYECLFITSSKGLTLTMYNIPEFDQPINEYYDSSLNGRIYLHGALINRTTFVGVAASPQYPTTPIYYDFINMPSFSVYTVSVEVLQNKYIWSTLSPNPYDPNSLLVVTTASSLISVNILTLQPDGSINIPLTQIVGINQLTQGQLYVDYSVVYFVTNVPQSSNVASFGAPSPLSCNNRIGCTFVYTILLDYTTVYSLVQIANGYDPSSIFAGYDGEYLNLVGKESLQLYFVDPSSGNFTQFGMPSQFTSVYSANLLYNDFYIIGDTNNGSTTLYTNSLSPQTTTLLGPNDQTGISAFGYC